MARSARGLPADFALDLPDEKPVQIGDFLDEEPMTLPVLRTPVKPRVEPTVRTVETPLRPELVRTSDARADEPVMARPLPRSQQQPSVIRYQLNLTPKAKTMLEDLVEHVRTYSPQG